MENELKRQLTRIRLATIAMRHNVRHTFDEFREHFASWRPTEIEPMASAVSHSMPERRWLLRLSSSRRVLLQGATLILLFSLSIGLGAVLKASADEQITIGHEDYRLIPAERLYDLNTLRDKAIANGAPLAVDTKPVYPVCTDDLDVPIDETAL